MHQILNLPGLIQILQTINADRLTLAHQNLWPYPDRSETDHSETDHSETDHSEAERLIETLFQPSQSLAVYGTLAPGAANAAVMATISGQWQPGQVRGHRYANSAGAAIGYPGLVWDMAASLQTVQLFRSPDLPNHWPRLDEFEGEGYVRILVPVEMPESRADATEIQLMAIANLYALRPASIPQ
ncbi:MAG: gamma-glutamylcyclotransferase [Leptolyngbyaceae cyanobacterium]